MGDVHGRADLLDALLGRIPRGGADLAGAATVFLGDYVDRGPDAAGVLARLRALCRDDPRTVCLMGNHERMMLDVLDRPERCGPAWLHHGGRETLRSYGLETAEGDAPATLAAALRAALPAGTEDWLRALPSWHRSGDVVCVHAGMNALRRPSRQRSRALLWGRGPFLHWPRPDRLWTVHGHTVVPDPLVRGRRIAVDTGAWFSDRLTAAVLVPGAPVRFVQTGDG